MNARLLLLVLGAACSCLFHCFGGDTNNLDDYLISVRSTNRLTLGVEMREPDGTNSTEVRIGLAFKAPAGAHSIIFIPKDEYLARLSLWDANNTPVAATRLGANYGRHFGDLYYDIKKFASQPHGPRNASDKWEGGAYFPNFPTFLSFRNLEHIG